MFYYGEVCARNEDDETVIPSPSSLRQSVASCLGNHILVCLYYAQADSCDACHVWKTAASARYSEIARTS